MNETTHLRNPATVTNSPRNSPPIQSFDERTDQSYSRPSLPQNISGTERLGSALGGVALALAGVSRGKLSGLLMTACGGALLYRSWTGHCHLYDALGIDTASHKSSTAVPAGQGVKVKQSITVNRSPEDLYAFWRNFENLPGVMRHLESVEELDGHRSKWKARGPLGISVEWEAEMMDDRPAEMIAWRSLPDSQVDTAGSVHFQQQGNDRGTVVTVSMKYNPPAGKAGDAVASLLGGGLKQELQEDLAAFKSKMEAGEIPTAVGQPHGQ